jgi:DNA-binding LacI/PurR family transcriptional regulator
MSPASLPLTHEVVRDSLRREVVKRWRPGDRIPPIRQLARDLGFGESNTFKAVRELVRAGVLASRPGQGTFVVHPVSQPSPRKASESRAATPSLASKRARVFVHRQSANDSFLLRMVDAFIDAVAPTGLAIARETTDYASLDKMDRYAEDALVLFNPGPTGRAPGSIRFAPRQTLTVITTADLVPVEARGGFDIVTVDQEQGAYLAGVALRDAGVSDAVFLGVGPERGPYDAISTARLAGFERGLGRPLSGAHRLSCVAYDEAPGALAVREFAPLVASGELGPRPGVFAASDDLAIGFALGAAGQGLLPGEHYQLVGFDGQQRGRDMRLGALTSVDVPSEQMGRRAAELLISRLHDPQQPVHRLHLGCSLFEGRTARKRT